MHACGEPAREWIGFQWFGRCRESNIIESQLEQPPSQLLLTVVTHR
jgi:hypothetical protein